MLKELTIENVAVIEKAVVIFDKGFNALTGETGAGKSILIDSINAILGNRTSKDIVRNGAKKAVIWATFDNISKNVKTALENAGYTPDDELIIQREIGADGKSACRINGKPAAAAVLREICESLINIHGQHDNQNLLNSAKHLTMLDTFADDEEFLQGYKKEFRALVTLEKQIKGLSENEDEKESRLELLKFQINEIKNADIKPGEEERLKEEKNAIINSQRIIEAVNAAHNALSGENGVVAVLNSCADTLGAASGYSKQLAELSEKMSEIYYSAQELSLDLNGAAQGFDFEPNRLETVEDRLDEIYRLKQKYGATETEILEYAENAENQAKEIELNDEQLDTLLEQRDKLYEKVKLLADKLTSIRLSAFNSLSEKLVKSLEFLNMPGIRFSLCHTTGRLTVNGKDNIEFYISTNPGEAPKPLAKIASGGELSRIMLAFKSALAEADSIDTVIYDEIDTGISGTAAGRVGKTLKETSTGRQVICVTHSAQIAACADRHLLIKKEVKDGRTFTEIQLLDASGRAKELARIISGDNVTELSLASADEMLKMAGN